MRVVEDRDYATVNDVLVFLNSYGVEPDSGMPLEMVELALSTQMDYIDTYLRTSWRLKEVSEEITPLTENYKWGSGLAIPLSYVPVQSVESVVFYRGLNNSPVEISVDKVKVFKNRGVIVVPHWDFDMLLYPGVVTVTYRFGYNEDPPNDIKLATILLTASYLLANWEFTVLNSASDLSPSRQFRIQDWTARAHDILDRYKRVHVAHVGAY